MNRDVVRQFAVIAALVGTVIMNGLSSAGLLNNQTPAEISGRLANLFVPANYVFSIWGLIYTLLIGYVVYQALPAQRQNPVLRQIGWWFVASCFANAGWLLLFHYNQFGWSVLAMVALLLCLLVIYVRIGATLRKPRLAERIWVQGAFSVYIGWITVATVANVAYALFDAGYNESFLGIPGVTWAIVMLIVATAITAFMVLTQRDYAYAGVIVWALIGIIIAQAETTAVANTAGIMVLAVASAALTRWWTGRRSGGSGGLAARAA